MGARLVLLVPLTDPALGAAPVQRARLTYEPRFRPLGQATAPSGQAWDAYLLALRDRARSATVAAVDSYRTLRGVRQALGLPVFATPEGEANPGGALTRRDEQQLLELGGVVDVASKAIDDAVAGKRRVAFGDDGAVLIEALPGDAARVVVSGDRPVLLGPDGRPVQVTGTIDGFAQTGHLGIIPVGVAVLVGAGVVVTVAALWAAVRLAQALQVAIQEKTTRTLAEEQTKQIAAGATPEQAKANTEAILKGQADVQRARNEAGRQETSDLTSTIRTVAVVAAVIAGLYFAARVIPEILPRRAEAA